MACAPSVTKTIALVNLRLLGALFLPGVLTSVHIHSAALLWRLMGRSGLPSGFERTLVHRAAVLSVSATGTAVLLSKPTKKLVKKWLSKVWEREYVVRKKLRNIDDPIVDAAVQEGVAVEAET